jgi:hypothetical protein
MVVDRGSSVGGNGHPIDGRGPEPNQNVLVGLLEDGDEVVVGRGDEVELEAVRLGCPDLLVELLRPDHDLVDALPLRGWIGKVWEW